VQSTSRRPWRPHTVPQVAHAMPVVSKMVRLNESGRRTRPLALGAAATCATTGISLMATSLAAGPTAFQAQVAAPQAGRRGLVPPGRLQTIAMGDHARDNFLSSDDGLLAATSMLVVGGTVGLAAAGTALTRAKVRRSGKNLRTSRASDAFPHRGGKMEQQVVAMAAYAGEEVVVGEVAKKTQCLHPDKPLMFACGDCPRRGGKMEQQAVAVAAYAGEEVVVGEVAKKTQCLHPDKPLMFACGDCPRRG